jgi:large subunit ribosomal protein L10
MEPVAQGFRGSQAQAFVRRIGQSHDENPQGSRNANRLAGSRPAATRRLRAAIPRRLDMPTEAKRETVAQLTEEARSASAMIVSEYRGLKVSEIGEIRRSLRKQNVTYHVVKNRLMKIAARDAGVETLGILLEGPTAVAFVRGDEAAAAKAVLDAVRPYRLVKVTGAVLGTRVIDADGVVRLSQLPGRDVLMAQVVGAIAAPMSTMAGLFDAPLRDIAGLVQALADKASSPAA